MTIKEISDKLGYDKIELRHYRSHDCYVGYKGGIGRVFVSPEHMRLLRNDFKKYEGVFY